MHSAGALAAGRLDEASGLAASTRQPDLLWAINDSGNAPILYALDAQGHDLGAFTVSGAQNRDWEDLAAFELDGKHYLLVADTGDNTATHKRYRLDIVEEPRTGTSGKVALAWSIPFVYPDGSRDCEAVAVDADAERVLLLSKRELPPRVFAVPLRAPSGAAPVRAVSVGRLEVNPAPALGVWAALYEQPTAWDISPTWIAVLNYRRVAIYRRAAREPVLAALARPPATLDFSGLAQAEALALAPDGSLYVTGEGAGSALLSSRCACDGCDVP